MSILVTWEEVNRVLDEILGGVDEGFVYPEAGTPAEVVDWDKQYSIVDLKLANSGNCMYATQDGKPSCIVGQIYHRFGGDVSELPNGEVSEIMGSGLDDNYIMVDDYRTYVLLEDLQRWQDMGCPWHKTAEKARAHADVVAEQFPPPEYDDE